MSQKRFFSPSEAAEMLGVSGATVRRVCAANPGFAINLCGAYRIPRQHVDAVKRGERPAAIAARVRNAGAARA